MTAVWPETIVDALKALAADGLSASQAAAHFNGMTRNAACGLAARKGFHFLNRGGGEHKPSTKNPHIRSTPFIEPPQREVSAAPIHPPRHGQLTLDELRHDSCRFIEREVHDPNHRYCGLQTDLDESWCPYHMAIVYVPREQRSR